LQVPAKPALRDERSEQAGAGQPNEHSEFGASALCILRRVSKGMAFESSLDIIAKPNYQRICIQDKYFYRESAFLSQNEVILYDGM